ncbi:TPA: hypothetical protein H5P67_000379 [Escherichia coli]|nr:hypothetical protein [Escherichia coli]
MKFRRLHNWNHIEQCTALIYFTELMEELLFDYTHSTYKPSIMNTPSLCIEAISTIDDIEKGNISPAHISHVIDELTKNIKNDDIAISLLKNPLGSFLDQLKNNQLGNKNLKITLELLRVQLNVGNYESKLISELCSTITSEYNPNKIRKFTRLLITHLISKGLSQEYLMESLKKHFFQREREISSNEEIITFLENIPSETQEYSVYFNADKSFSYITPCLSQLEIEVVLETPENINETDFFDNHEQRTILVKHVKALDPFTARRVAEKNLKLASTLLSLYHHKQEASWSAENIVVSENGEKINIRSSINPMHRCKDLVQEHASRRLEQFMNNFRMRKDSFNKFIRSVQLHSMALQTNAVENQLLNLWIAIESLIPDESKKEEQSTIEHIVNSLTPFLNLNYIEDLVRNLIKDLQRWNHPRTMSLLRLIGDSDAAKSFVILVASQEHAPSINQFKIELSQFPLLKERFEYISNLISSTDTMYQALKNHAERINWQIRRIYRTRNLIVHTGKTPSKTNVLVEHAHIYLDAVINSLIKLSSHPVEILSVAQGFRNVEMKYKMYIQKLNKKNIELTPENIISFIFNQ